MQLAINAGLKHISIAELLIKLRKVVVQHILEEQQEKLKIPKIKTSF
jgi:hypothetical protein